MEEVEGEGGANEEKEKMEGLDLELPSFSEDKQAANQPPRKGSGKYYFVLEMASLLPSSLGPSRGVSGLSTRRKGNQSEVENGGGLRSGTPDAPPVVVPIVTTSKADDGECCT